MAKEKIVYFENLPKATMQREINEFLMNEGLTPFTAFDRSILIFFFSNCLIKC